MLTLRRSAFNPCVFRTILSKSLKTKTQKMSNQVHKEIMKYIDSYAKIKIQSDILLKVRAADVHRYPNADVLVAELHGSHSKNCNIEMSVKVSEDLKEIDVKVGRIGNEDLGQAIYKQPQHSICNEIKNILDVLQEFHCVLAVPVKAALNIEGKNAVYIEQMLGERLEVLATNNIKTRDVRCELVSIKSTSGKIICAGMLLGQKTCLETKQNNCVILDKLQGDEFLCKTEGGDIHSSCCYVEDSKFETESGCLDLKNVHKRSKVVIKNHEGSLHMTGVHGNLQVESNGKILNLQLSELQGNNLIVANNAENATINISEGIEHSTELNITAQNIKLDDSLHHLKANLGEKSDCLHYEPNRNCDSKLTVCSNGNVNLGKLSWAEMMSKSFEKKPTN